ncbi:hypothetical protein [Aquimarina agarivorans]|uniref:hypothetical protein n=1 Tax=Aquimarina agarivorans TaxID=980584 RepID=UPI0002E6B319|nr:hypothetical protein [Aquimarina agarivorans]
MKINRKQVKDIAIFTSNAKLVENVSDLSSFAIVGYPPTLYQKRKKALRKIFSSKK